MIAAAASSLAATRRAAVEAEPADPQQRRADHDQRRAVRQHQRLGKAHPLAEQHGRDQRRDAGRGVDDDAAGEIHRAHAGGQPAAAPHPVGDRRIDHQAPQRREGDHPAEPRPVDPGADHQRRRDRGEHHLEEGERALRDLVTLADVAEVEQHPGIAAADPAVGHLAERQGVAGDDPQQRDDRGDRAALHADRQDVLGAHQAAVEQRQARHRHQQHERRRGQDPGSVAAVGGVGQRFLGAGETGQGDDPNRRQGSHELAHDSTPRLNRPAPGAIFLRLTPRGATPARQAAGQAGRTSAAAQDAHNLNTSDSR